MKWNNEGVLPLLIIFVILGIVLLFGVMILAALTLKMILTLLLVGVGVYLLIKPQLLSTMPPVGKWAVPIVLIVLGIAVYGGWVKI